MALSVNNTEVRLPTGLRLSAINLQSWADTFPLKEGHISICSCWIGPSAVHLFVLSVFGSPLYPSIQPPLPLEGGKLHQTFWLAVLTWFQAPRTAKIVTIGSLSEWSWALRVIEIYLHCWPACEKNHDAPKHTFDSRLVGLSQGLTVWKWLLSPLASEQQD